MALSELWPGGPLFDPGGGMPLGMDSLLLADFARPARGRALELCCGAAAVTLLLLSRMPELEADGVELLPAAARSAERNLAANGLERRARVICGDIRAHRALLKAGAYSLCVCNPPYFPAGSGRASSDRAARSPARRWSVRSRTCSTPRPGRCGRAGPSAWCTARSAWRN